MGVDWVRPCEALRVGTRSWCEVSHRSVGLLAHCLHHISENLYLSLQRRLSANCEYIEHRRRDTVGVDLPPRMPKRLWRRGGTIQLHAITSCTTAVLTLRWLTSDLHRITKTGLIRMIGVGLPFVLYNRRKLSFEDSFSITR